MKSFIKTIVTGSVLACSVPTFLGGSLSAAVLDWANYRSEYVPSTLGTYTDPAGRNPWQAGSLTKTLVNVNSSGVDVKVTITGNVANFSTAQTNALGISAPQVSHLSWDPLSGGLRDSELFNPKNPLALVLDLDQTAWNQSVSVNFEYFVTGTNTPATVKDVSFQIYDIDLQTSDGDGSLGYVDEVRGFTSTFNGQAGPAPTLLSGGVLGTGGTGGSSVHNEGTSLYGIAANLEASKTGHALVSYGAETSLNSHSLTYGNYNNFDASLLYLDETSPLYGSVASNQPVQQFIGIGNISFTPVSNNVPPCLSVVKNASKAAVVPYEPVAYSYTVTNCGGTTLTNVVVTDDNATPSYAADDFTVGTVASLAAGQSVTFSAVAYPVVSTIGLVGANVVPAGAVIVVKSQDDQTIRITYLQDFGVNDNTYGTGIVGWPRGHNFKDLVESDKLELRLFDKSGKVVLDFYLDTISAGNSVTVPGTGQVISYPAGYGTMGPFGGEGTMIVGNPNDIVTFSTSITENLNNPANLANKDALMANSPTSLSGGQVVVDSAKAPGGWNHINNFTVVVKASAFAAGGGFGSVEVPDQHNSPNKLTGPHGMITRWGSSEVTNIAVARGGNLTASASATVDVIAPPLVPAPWQSADLGTVSAPGTTYVLDNIFTLYGSGSGLTGSSDAFQFVSQQANGDCSVVARVTSLPNGLDNTLARAGVVIRDSLNPGSVSASVTVTQKDGIVFSTRAAANGAVTSTTKAKLKAPYWVKLTRTGNSFVAAYSANGSSWTTLGTKTLTMGATPLIGLGATSSKDGVLTTATLDNVSVTP